MWTCLSCGCQNIAASLAACPMCRKDRAMPKITEAGPTNAAAAEGEPGYVAPEGETAVETPLAVPEPVAEPVPAAPEGDAGPVVAPAPEPAPAAAETPPETVSA